MPRNSALRTLVVLASIFLLTLALLPLLAPLEHRIYDWCLATDHDFHYGDDRRHPAVKMLAYSESTGHEVGAWTVRRSNDLANHLLSRGAAAMVFHPAAQDELKATPREDVFLADRSTPEQTLPTVSDSDGVCRRVALALKVGDAWKPSLPLLVFARLARVRADDIRFLPSAIEVGFARIETDPEYRIFVRFRRSTEALTSKTQTDDDLSASIDPMIPTPLSSYFRDPGPYSKLAKDSAVLVGASFKQANNLVVTPLGPLADFKVHACVLETLLGDWKIWEPRGALRVGLILSCVLACYAFFIRLPVAAIALFWGVSQGGALWLAQAAFPWGVFVPYTPWLLSSTLVALAVSVLKLRQAGDALRRFGGAGAYEAGLRGDETIFEEVREKIATIVFTNVLSYLKELERNGSPEDFFERRQAYAQLLTEVFRKHGGVILDYQGDFQMIGFNVELRQEDPDHAVHAVRASQEFLARLPEITVPWREAADNNAWWETGSMETGSAHCGICTGVVACGHVGSRRHDGGRIAQAAIGDTSNVAARLLGAAMKLNEPIVLAMTTAEAARGEVAVEMLEAIPLKGKTQPVPIGRPARGAQE